MHYIYKLLGHIICRLLLVYWNIYDFISPPNTNSILFVAHPDDDTLFFHSFIKEHRPYIVLLFTGWSIKRMIDFYKVMQIYKVRFRAYDTISSGAYDNIASRKKVENHIKKCIELSNFKLCATHNSEGEYGHSTHKLVHEIVVKTLNKQLPIICPVHKNHIEMYPLSEELINEKCKIFKNFYKTESWVIEQYSIWVKNEKLININE